MTETTSRECYTVTRRAERGKVLRGSTQRTHRLALDAAKRKMKPFCEQAQLYETAPRPEGLSPMLAEAHVFAYVHPRLTPVIHDGELIVGARVRGGEGGWNWFPDGSATYVEGFAKNAPADRPDIQKMAARGLLSPQGSLNHKVVDYAGFIRTGSAELARRAREVAEQKTGEEREFALAFAMGHEAMMAHAQTYACACENLAESATPVRAAELREMARICAKVPAYPAETFHEALQSLWFAYMTAGDATGRVDVYLKDFYEADLAAGRITPQKALELIECFMIKLHGDTFQGIVNVSSVQTMTLGGLLPDGSDATNDLTRLFLQAIRNVRLLRPTVYLRCHAKTPEDVIDFAVTMLAEGLCEPSFYGDAPVIKGLNRLGIPLEVARDYALSGCTEIVSPGRGNWGAPNGWVNIALIVDDALRDYAASARRDATALWAVIEQHIESAAEACRVCNIWLDEQRKDPHYPGTLLMPVTLQRCRDIVHGGAETYLGHWEGIGLPNAADMIYTALEMGLRNGGSLAHLFKRLDAEDVQLLRQIHTLPKYGNGHESVDAIAARLVAMLGAALEKRKTPLRSALVLGHLAGGENMHIAYGMIMGPTLDGRRAGQPLADSLAGSQGRTIAGPTATILSLCRLDHSRLVAGSASTLRLSSADCKTAEARKKVAALIRAFVAMGGSQLQINMVDADTLHKAQANPERFRGLLVRVAGYSADFTLMGKTLQDEIITRTKQGSPVAP